MSTRTIAPLAALLSLAACAPKFDGPEKIQGLRLIAVQAEPPELGAAADATGAGWPADSADVRSLVAHPDFAAAGSTTEAVILHLGCTPTPGDPTGTACTQMSELAEPSQLLQSLDLGEACTAPGLGKVNAITFSGLEACGRLGCGPLAVRRDPGDASSSVTLPTPRYRVPASLDPAQPGAGAFSLAALPAGHPQRVIGLDVVDLALVVQVTPAELAPATAVGDDCAALATVLVNLQAIWPQRANLASLKWIHVRGPDMPAESPPNHNPSVAGIHYDVTRGGATVEGALPALGGAPFAATAGETLGLRPDFGAERYESLRERFQQYDTAGKYIKTRDEEWAYSWFTTAGDLEYPITHADDPRNTLPVEAGDAVLWLVVRDLRGGMAWTAAGLSVAP